MPGIDIAIRQILIVNAILFLLFFIIDIAFFRKKIKRPVYRGRLINVLITIGILTMFVASIKVFTWPLLLQIFLLNTVDLSILILATTGVVLIFKTSVTTNFAQGMMATFGAFFATTVVIRLMAKYSGSQTLYLFIGLFSGVLVSFLLGLIIDVGIIRRGRHVSSVGKQMITMGLVMVLMGAIPVIFGSNPIALPAFSIDVEIFNIGEHILVIPIQNLYAIVITLVVLVVLFTALRFTKWGLGVRATASSEMVASMMGVNTRVITAMSWAIAGGLGAIAAFFYASSGAQVQVASMVGVQVNAFMAAVLGSFSSFGGPIVGALLINLFSSIAPFYDGTWQVVIVYGIILLIVLAKPLGLFGKKTAKKV
ncbi:MAG: branched-chain amino acid ABC transporter permease [Candidatus Izemoplasmatales bacterium]|nr:branched-chain amino acid ABC transporter permease [Candidatus Izemoplasmatales bacterium]